MAVDIVGDSYTAGEGIQATYVDSGDQRHRSLVAPALQALSRVANGNPGMKVDANIVASSGAVTGDFFTPQKTQDGQAMINEPQVDQLRPTAQLVIVGFGGNDALLAQVLAEAKQSSASMEATVKKLAGLLASDGTPEEYFAQAKSSTPGQAPTLVARMLQVLAGVANRAPNAGIVVTNYPLAVDPQNKHSSSLISEQDLTTVRKFQHDLNRAIDRAVQICGCANLVDISGAVAGHEAYTVDSAFNERSDQQSPREMYYPNRKGASLIANPIAIGIARLLGVKAPSRSEDLTVPTNIKTRSGVSDRDGDQVPDARDRAPNDPTRADEQKPVHHKDERKADSPAGHRGQPHKPAGARSKSGDPGRQHSPVAVVTKVVGDLLPGGNATPGHNQAGQPKQAPGKASAEPVDRGSDQAKRDDTEFGKLEPEQVGWDERAQVTGEDTRGVAAEPAGRVKSVRLFARQAKSNGTGPDKNDPAGFTLPPTQAPKQEPEAVTEPARLRVTGQEASERKPDAASIKDAAEKIGKKSVRKAEVGWFRNSEKLDDAKKEINSAEATDNQVKDVDKDSATASGEAEQEEVTS